MITQENFELGENINNKIYDYDEFNIKHTRKIEGKVYQITKNFVVIDNGKYKECFKYSQFEEDNKEISPRNYDQYLDYYRDDIVEDCIEDFKTKGEGFVFSLEQLAKVVGNSGMKNSDFIVRQENGITFIKKS